MTRIYGSLRAPGILGSAERGFCRLVRTNPDEEQTWREYGLSMLVFSVASTAVL